MRDILKQYPSNFTKVSVKKVYQTYVIFELGALTELKQAADLLVKQDAILACEWLQQRRLFGISADISEMAKFKSKIKKNEDITGVKANSTTTPSKETTKKIEDL